MAFLTENAKTFIDDKTVTKFFNTRQYRDPFYRVTYDYNPLLDLQGIPSVPKLYGYKRNVFVIMERCDGTLWSTLSKEEESEMKAWLYPALETHYIACIKRGWVPQDVKKEHIFLDPIHQTVQLIDYGRYLSAQHPYYQMVQFSIEEWIAYKTEEIRSLFRSRDK